MRKVLSMLVAFSMAFSMSGCGKQKTYQTGTYTAQYENYDSRGYRDYITITVAEGQVTSIAFNGINAEGGLKTEDEAYRQSMEAVQNNYPQQVNNTLINQYLVVQSIDKVDVVAGATYSTESFTALFKALEAQMYEGNETPLVVPNIPEK